MEGILNSLASADPVRLWLWGGFALVATLYVLNKVLLHYLTRKPSGMPNWKPRRPPIWLTDWRRPKRPPHPGGLLSTEQSRELFRQFDLVRSLAIVRTGKLQDAEVQTILADLFFNLHLRNETQPAIQWATEGKYRRALRYVVRLARWAERHYRPPLVGYMVAYGDVATPVAPFALYSEAGALAHCLDDGLAARYFEKARSFDPKDPSTLIVLSYFYWRSGQREKLAEVTGALLIGFQHKLASVEKGLKDGRYPGIAGVDAGQEVESLKARIEKTRQRLEHLNP